MTWTIGDLYKSTLAQKTTLAQKKKNSYLWFLIFRKIGFLNFAILNSNCKSNIGNKIIGILIYYAKLHFELTLTDQYFGFFALR